MQLVETVAVVVVAVVALVYEDCDTDARKTRLIRM